MEFLILPIRAAPSANPTILLGAHNDDKSSPAQRRPHGAIALRRPDHRMLDALGLVVGPRHVEGHAMFVDGKASKFRIHHPARFVVGLFEAAALGGTVGDAAK